MAKESRSTIADSIPNDQCFTIEDLATEFDLSTIRMRQVVDKAIKERIVPNVTKKDGRRILFAPQMVEQLKEAKERGKLGKFNRRNPKTALKHANFVIQVPIFDPNIAELLKKKFAKEELIAKYLQTKAEESVKPILAKQRALKEEYEKKMASLLSDADFSL